MTETLASLIATHEGSARALGAPDRGWMDYETLRALSGTVASTLHQAGVGRGDRVAIVLPNGPEMAVAFVTVAQVATTCPLNPAYKEDEFAFYLEDLKAKAIILMRDEEGPALAAARALGLNVIRLVPDAQGPAGGFALAPEGGSGTADSSAPGPDDVALILHTSGTTSRPKIVPLLQSNLAASARNIGASLRALALGPLPQRDAAVPYSRADGGGVVDAGAGAQVWCAPGFDALKFFGWMREADPTWYTAVPTMHQAILRARAQRRDHRGTPPALPALLLGLAAGAGDDQAGRDLRRAGDRGLRHDRGGAPDGLQPAAAPGAEARRRGPARRPRSARRRRGGSRR
jgi:acyl-CoA synthetase (AMP-forming)/AMP-acid ligase II